jgi:hypothetical protein
MNTNNIKSFAKKARLLLREGVAQRLKFWGFTANGMNEQTLSKTEGGYIFRGRIYTDVQTPQKWDALKKRIRTKEDVQDVVEEAAYTWFNRLIAIKILEQNGFIDPQLAFDGGQTIPTIMQNAKRGNHHLTKADERALLTEYIQDDKDENAFSLLLTDLCHRNRVLRDVFGRIDDYTEMLIPQDLLNTNGVMALLNSDAIPTADYKEVELIGWLYQFYIADKKDEVFAGFKKNKKARAQDVPAATQIFTPKWIVKYMVENTIGKSYLDYNEDSDLKAGMKYLVESSEETASPSLIDDINELTLIDPACGSGHILVTGFELLFDMYREEGYMASQAVEQILEHNIYGLDIDDRAMQLARFAVLLKAASYDRGVLDGGTIPHIYSYPEDTISNYFYEKEYANKTDWSDLLGMALTKPIGLEWIEIKIDTKTKVEKPEIKKVTFPIGAILSSTKLDLLVDHCQEAITTEYSAELELFWGDRSKGFEYANFFNTINLLRQGKNLGSTIKLSLTADQVAYLKTRYQNWQEREQKAGLGVFEQSIWNNLQPYLDVLFILAKQYVAVVANPPYMGQKNMNADLKDYTSKYYPNSKNDLYTVFIDKISEMPLNGGMIGLITPPSWMFTSSFANLRKYLLNHLTIDSLLNLGRGVFGVDFGSSAFTMNLKSKPNSIGVYRNLFREKVTVDSPEQKEKWFFDKDFNYYESYQKNFKKIKNSPVAFWLPEKVFNFFETFQKIENIVNVKQGLATGDNNRFRRSWHEVKLNRISFNGYDKLKKWYPYNSGGQYRKWYGNHNYIVDWSNGGYEIKNFKDDNGKVRSRAQNISFYFKESGSWSKMTASGLALRYYPEGFIFDVSGCSFFGNKADLKYLIGLLNSELRIPFIDAINQSFNYEVGQISNVPLLVDNHFDKVVILVDEVISTSMIDWNSYETSWDFEQSSLLNESSNLQEAFKSWSQSVKEDFFQLHSNEEELNRIFIGIYGLQEELTPEVSLKDITILQGELDRKELEKLEPIFRTSGKEAIELPILKDEVLSQFVSYCIGLFMGRYRLDKTGLNIAHPNPTEEELAAYLYKGQSIEIDEDAIIPLIGDDGAFPDDALTRLKKIILTIWGEDTLTENINFLQACLGMDLHKWLTTKFWGYHTGMYKKKPIYWLFSSNAKKPQNSAFKVLVYMHRMDKFTVQKIQRKYLHPHQEFIKHEITRLAENQANLSKEEIKKLEQYRNWKIECRDYNEVLKELANRQIELDLDDGVDANYPKFEGALAQI